MSPRTGRPIKGNAKRNKSLQLRLSEDELERLDQCAQELNCSRTDVVSKGISLVHDGLHKKEK